MIGSNVVVGLGLEKKAVDEKLPSRWIIFCRKVYLKIWEIITF